MSNDVIISAENVGKKFCRSLKRTLVYGVKDVARDVFGITPQSEELRRDEFWALSDVSFEVKRGECLGLIGANGAGKSTLLKMLNGVVLPDKGTIRVHGRIGALLELGAGFHPMLTGRENIHLSGAILGLSKKEIEDKFSAIVEFSGLKDFIDSPVKYYSSGMYVRLGFAVAAHAEPDILLIDEALAVGDVLFQAKCFAKLHEFKEKGTTIIFVTHSLDLVTSHCSRAILLDGGKLLSDQSPKEVVDQLNRLFAERRHGNGEISKTVTQESHWPQPKGPDSVWNGSFELTLNEQRYGTYEAEILEAGIFDRNDAPAQVLERNREYLVKIRVRHNKPMSAAIVAYTIRDAKGVNLCGTNTLFQNIDMGKMERGSVVLVTFKQVIRLNPGKYLLAIGCGKSENGDYIIYDRRFDYMPFQVVGNEPRVGLFDPGAVVDWVVAK